MPPMLALALTLFAATLLRGAEAPAPDPASLSLPQMPQLDTALPTPPTPGLDNSGQGEAAQVLGPEKERAARLEKYFRLPQTDIAALSPDGKYIAYSLRESGTSRDGSTLFVITAASDNPGKRLIKCEVLTDDDATPKSLALVRIDPVLAQIQWMAWFPPARLVLYTNRNIIKMAGGSSMRMDSYTGELLAFNADGSNLAQLATPLKIETSMSPNPHPFTLGGFCTDDPQSVLLLVRGRGDDYLHTAFKLNVITGKMTITSEEWPIDAASAGRRAPPPQYITDRQGRMRITLPLYDRNFDNKPRTYNYTAPGARAVWKDLNQVAGKASATFTVPAGGPNAPETQRSIPIGFDAANPDILYYASNVPVGKYGIYGLNLATGKRTSLDIDDSDLDMVRPATTTTGFIPDNILMFDRFKNTLAGVRILDPDRPTEWLQQDLRLAQTKIEGVLSDSIITILGWSQDRSRYIARASGPADPGGYYLFDNRRNRMDEFVECRPWLDSAMLHKRIEPTYLDDKRQTHTFACTMPEAGGLRPGGYRVVVLCRPDPDPAEFRSDAQALASMGYVVVEAGIDGPSILHALDALAKRIRVDPRRVAIFGEAAYAVTALNIFQSNPTRFRCAIAIEAALDDESGIDVRQINRPVCLVNDPASLASSNSKKPYYYHAAKTFVNTVRKNGADDSMFADLPDGYLQNVPLAKAKVYAGIETFLYVVNTKARVILGPMDVIEQTAPAKK